MIKITDEIKKSEKISRKKAFVYMVLLIVCGLLWLVFSRTVISIDAFSIIYYVVMLAFLGFAYLIYYHFLKKYVDKI